MIEFFINKRKITLVFFSMLVLIGMFISVTLPKQEQPDIIVSMATITTVYPGATPEKVEQTVTKKLEEKINEVQGIKSISSESRSGVSIINVQTENDVEPKTVFEDVRKKVKDAEADLPDEAEQPFINDDMSRTFIQTFQITANSFEEILQLRDMLDLWKDQLRTVPGVSDVSIQGLPEQEVKVAVDAQKLQQYGISWAQVIHAVQTKNETTPLGDVNIDTRKYQLTLPVSYEVATFEKVVVTRTQEGMPVYLKDIATISDSTKRVEYRTYYNGKPAATISINAELGSDVPAVQKAVDTKLATLEKSLPAWAKKEPVFLQVDRIDSIFSELYLEMIIAIIAVLFICILGLNVTTSLMVALAIPISLAAGMVVLPFFGITLNQMTVFGLIIVLGILVDDAVVVNDNIERRLSALGEDPYTAAVAGTKEVAISIVTATLATISAFGPIMFLPGDAGQFIFPVPLIIIFTMAASMFMSLTIIPIYREWNERRNKKRSKAETDYRKPAGLLGKQIDALTNWYGDRVLKAMLKHPLKTGVSGILIATAIYGLAAVVPVQLFPDDDRPQMVVNITTPIGGNLQETDRIALGVSQWIAKQAHIQKVSSFVGGNAPQMMPSAPPVGTGEHVAQLIVTFDNHKMDARKVLAPWSEQFKRMYPEANIIPYSVKAGMYSGNPVGIRVYGDDLQQLYALSEQIKQLIMESKGTYNINDTLGNEQYSLQFHVNQEKMDKELINEADLTRTLRLISQGIPMGQFDNGKNLIDITLVADQPGMTTEQVFAQLTVPNARGQLIPVSQIAEMKPDLSMQSIPRYNMSRSVTITSDVRDRTAADVMSEITAKMEQLELPDGYGWNVTGETEEESEVLLDLGVLAIVAVFLIFLLIVLQFNSLSIPVLVMSTVYLAIAGSLIGLFITSTPIGFMTVAGFIALAGIVVRNGIVLIEFIEEARHQGVSLNDAVIRAGKARLRPILLTTFAAVAGLSPMAITGSVLFQPLAITIISGLLFSMLLTLIVVPSLYTVIAIQKEKKRVKKEAQKQLTI
ncbi:efflux RND transporter permease subunit [Brevibacillus sp. AF8]|uniref:efflux RND transporter permease subunit n=1 Tax=Brevibacillus sp. AF8 TaxID=2825881 RepID=UPI001E527694|nr:efflux RND transporter permease subunit [Brevibacillus sp. AF8]MCE0449919.1 efflux RND transporter permease subunit [Brevibacillus sp. AF8]